MSSRGEDELPPLMDETLETIFQKPTWLTTPEWLTPRPALPASSPEDTHPAAAVDAGSESDSGELDSDTGSSSDDEFSDSYAKPDSQVCKYCEDILLAVLRGDEKDPDYEIPEHFNVFWRMKKSSKTCGLCWAMIEATEEHFATSPDFVYPWDRGMQLRGYELAGALYTKPYCNGEALRTAGIHELQLEMGGLDMPYFRLLIMADDGEGSIPQRAIWSDSVPLQLGSRLPVLKEWLASCSSDHAACKQRPKDKIYLPLRLVDLFESSHAGIFNPRLVFTDELDESNIQYTTLSHRWGDEQPVQTLTQNVRKFKKSIFPLHSRTKRRIPRTFADAMKITRALGLRYIWIDSLCIVQNDPSDWRREALHMGNVYRRSFLNIAAIDGLNCNTGCGLDVGWGAVSVTGPRLGGRRFRIRAVPADPAHVWHSSLNTRGWVFQELMLAPRILYCGRMQFLWQCREKVYSEDGYIDHHVPLNIPGDRWTYSHNRTWCSWVRDFSQRKFTKLTDRLPSLSGVIQRHFLQTRHTPILGMWKETLVNDLSWRTRQEFATPFHSFPTEQSNLRKVPSWSWLSICVRDFPGGVVYFPDLEGSVNSTRIESVEVVWASEPHFSEILSTKLVVSGPLRQLRLVYDEVFRRLYREEDGDGADEQEMYAIRLDRLMDDPRAYNSIRDYWCLQLERAEDRGKQAFTFLVLEETDGGGDIRAFRRLGCGRLLCRDVGDDWPLTERIELI